MRYSQFIWFAATLHQSGSPCGVPAFNSNQSSSSLGVPALHWARSRSLWGAPLSVVCVRISSPKPVWLLSRFHTATKRTKASEIPDGHEEKSGPLNDSSCNTAFRCRLAPNAPSGGRRSCLGSRGAGATCVGGQVNFCQPDLLAFAGNLVMNRNWANVPFKIWLRPAAKHRSPQYDNISLLWLV